MSDQQQAQNALQETLAYWIRVVAEHQATKKTPAV